MSHILRYARAHISGVGAVDSFSFARAKSKQSYWVLVEYEVDSESHLWVAKVLHFLKMSREGREDQRVAVATLFNRQRMVMEDLVHVVKQDQVYSSTYAIALSSIVRTLVSCAVEDPRAQDKRGPRHISWYDRADAGKVCLVRAANTSRFN